VVDQMRGGLDHPSRPARWAEATALTRKGLIAEQSAEQFASRTACNKVLETAPVAFNPNEAVFEAPASQMVAELLDDEGGQSCVVSCQFVGKRRQVLLNNRVERSLFRLVTPVPVDHRQRWGRHFTEFIPAWIDRDDHVGIV
jgi:hypothetical protein